MKKLLLLGFLFLNSCTYSQNMVNPEGQIFQCSSYGWGIIGGPMAINILNNCIASQKQLGFVEVEKVGVPGFYLSEGNPPIISRVQAGGPAEKAGILAGDKILLVNNQKVGSIRDVLVLGFCQAGETISYQIQRGEEIKSLSVITIPKAMKLE